MSRARNITSIANKALRSSSLKNWLISCDTLHTHKELDFAIKFTSDWKGLKHTSSYLHYYWPDRFNFEFDESVSGSAAEFTQWAQKEGYFTDKEIAFGLDMRTNALFRPSCEFARKFLAHRYAFCFYLFDDLYEYLMSFEGGRGLGDTFAHNFRAIVSGQIDLRPLEPFSSELKHETDKANLVQRTTADLINESRAILPPNVLAKWFEINYITYTTCVLESKLWRQKASAGQFVSRREYSDVKRFNSAFHSVLFILLDEAELVYFPIDEPLVANCSIGMCLDNDIFSFPKERQLQRNPFNTIKKLVAGGLSEYDSFRKLIDIRNDMVRAVEITDTYLPKAQQSALLKSYHFLGGLLNYHSSCIRFGWKNE